jgi:hypothetical protein
MRSSKYHHKVKSLLHASLADILKRSPVGYKPQPQFPPYPPNQMRQMNNMYEPHIAVHSLDLALSEEDDYSTAKKLANFKLENKFHSETNNNNNSYKISHN